MAHLYHLYSCLQPILYLNTVIFSARGLHALTMSLQDPGEENIKLSHARTVLAELEESRRREKLVDSVIQGAGQVRVPCHRLVLTAVSSVLRDAVMDTEEEVTIILVPDLSHEEIETFVQLIYTGVAETGAKSSSVIQLMKSLNIPLPTGASQEQELELEDHKAKEHRERREGDESLSISYNLGKNIQCTKCDEIFRWKAEFRRHSELVHGQKISDLVPCLVCHKMIVSKRLNEHIKTVHGNERNLSCQQCEKKFCKPSELRNHIRTHTGERPYTCDICDASFAYSHILARHKKYHDGTKKFTCKQCSKSFLQKNDLIKHGRIHSGEKPYKCETCGKDFARMDYLKKHQMLHVSSDSKYCCTDCGEIFGSLDGMKKHKNHSHRPNIDLNSFDDLALQLPGLEMESMPDSIQAVSLDGGKTIMILNEVADMESLDTVASEVTERPAEMVLSHSGVAESGDTAPVFYAVQSAPAQY